MSMSYYVFFLMYRRHQRSPRRDPQFPDATLFRARSAGGDDQRAQRDRVVAGGKAAAERDRVPALRHRAGAHRDRGVAGCFGTLAHRGTVVAREAVAAEDRKSTRLNSSN